MHYKGRPANWNDKKGCGFVTANSGGDKAFVHIKAFSTMHRRPVDGDLITYEVARGAQNCLQAKSILYAVEPKPAPRREISQLPGIVCHKWKIRIGSL